MVTAPSVATNAVVPIAFSFLGDLYSPEQRNTPATLVAAAMGVGKSKSKSCQGIDTSPPFKPALSCAYQFEPLDRFTSTRWIVMDPSMQASDPYHALCVCVGGAWQVSC